MADGDRLLSGEDPNSRQVEDTAHWIAVYSELLVFKERLLESAQRSLLEMTEELARSESANTDITVLAAERDRLRRRLDFWKGRWRELSDN